MLDQACYILASLERKEACSYHTREKRWILMGWPTCNTRCFSPAFLGTTLCLTSCEMCRPKAAPFFGRANR